MPGMGGGLPLEGVVAENFVPALESLSSLGFEERNLGCPRNFAGMSRTPGGVRKVCAKKLRAHFSFPTDLCLPRCVFRDCPCIWQSPSLGTRGLADIQCICLFALQISWGERGRYIVYLPDPLSRERDFTRYTGNP